MLGHLEKIVRNIKNKIKESESLHILRLKGM